MGPKGGTELAHEKLLDKLNPELAEKLQIVSRPIDLDPDKHKVLWVQDMPGDMEFMEDTKNRRMFSGIVFVSAWQQTIFNVNMGVPFSDGVVIKNAIEPIEEHEKPKDGTIRLIYHPTPHRGLQILVPVFVELCKHFDNLHLDVFSNFDLYARPEANEPFEELYDMCKEHPNITYHGTQPNLVVREAIKKADIFAYPSIWRETSCMAAMEAMSGRCLVVAPNYGALPETLANFNISYNWTENMQQHANIFASALKTGIENLSSDNIKARLDFQKAYADAFYNWNDRIMEWEMYLTSIVNGSRKVGKGKIEWN
jgi:glycosyltransferase involved in cell wall biosynthesis